MKTLVIGGTGTVGSQVARELVARGGVVRVLSRRAARAGTLPAGAECAVGDLQKPETLPEALRGVEAVFLATALAPDEINQGLAAVEAAREAGVRRFVHLSVHQVDEGVHIPHFAVKLPIEGAVRASGMAFTILRPNNFFQNDAMFRDALLRSGVYPQPLGEVGLHRVDVRDIAEAAALAIENGGLDGRTLPLVGPEPWTGPATAEAWSRALGRPIAYAGGDLDAWYAQALGMLPRWMALDLRIMYAWFGEHGLLASRAEVDEISEVLGHAPRSFADYAAETAAAWSGAGT